MTKVLEYLILVSLTSGITAAAGLEIEVVPQPVLLRDGLSLASVDGKLVSSDSNDVWFFELTEDVNDSGAVVKAGTKLELLPSSTLEKMIVDAKTRSTPAYRLWNAEVTRYKYKNFLFPRYFLPLSKREDEERKAKDVGPAASEPNTPKININEPNDILTIPPEIIARFRARQQRATTTSLRQMTDSNEVSAEAPAYTRGVDSVFVDRIGFVLQRDGGWVFVPNALGRNLQRRSFRLLPCEILELTVHEQSGALEAMRFKITGILTRYKNEEYLLLYKATRVYSYGNFGR
ncbi:MAG: hypothetical protein P8Z79_12210 [Sedimentisphaerales bacterium]|jgi:hypothetical protein